MLQLIRNHCTSAVLDACVLYSAALRDLWMYLAVKQAFQPKWTAQIQEEWLRNLLKNRPDLRAENLSLTRQRMEAAAGDWQLPEDAHLPPTVNLPDPNDRHVVAAALAGGVPTIVTFNLSDFPRGALEPIGVRALHPDAFACELLAADPATFIAAVRANRAALKAPPKTARQYLETLGRVGLPSTVAALEPYEDTL